MPSRGDHCARKPLSREKPIDGLRRLSTVTGSPAASYTYDPYGKVLTATGTLVAINPLRYRMARKETLRIKTKFRK